MPNKIINIHSNTKESLYFNKNGLIKYKFNVS